MKLVIVGGGSRPEPLMLKEACSQAEVVLAADRGGQWLLECGIVPDVLLGDFDSIDAGALASLQGNGHTRWVRHRTDKDQTDMELCVEEALQMGVDSVQIFGATGTRMDHSLANLLLLHPFVKAGVEAWIIDRHNRVRMAGVLTSAGEECAKTAGPFQVRLQGIKGFKVSLIALSPVVTDVTTVGLLYDMRGRNLPFGSTLAVSNEFKEERAEVRFNDGLMLLLLSKD